MFLVSKIILLVLPLYETTLYILTGVASSVMDCSLVVACVLPKAGNARKTSNVPTLGVNSRAKCKADAETRVYANGRSWKSLYKFKKCIRDF